MLAAATLAVLPEPLRRAIDAFSDEYLADGVPFGGREDELAALDGWLDDGRPCALIVAEAGRGKSALVARWVRRVAGRVPVAFLPVSIRFGTAQRMSSLRLLAAQLRQLSGVTGDAPRDPEAARAEIEAMLGQPRGDGARWLVVLDGIDEAVGWQVGRDLRLPRVPGLKILVSARALAGCDLDGWRKRLGWSAADTMGLALPALDARHVADVLRKMGDPLAALGDRSEIARMLARVTEGEPLVLRLYVDALRAYGDAVAFVTPADLSAVPPGIAGYFDRWWAEQRIAWGAAAEHLERDARDVLCALAVALGPLMREDLAAIVPERVPEVREASLRAIERFVIGDGRTRGYVFSHPRLAYYHAERMTADERAAWERRFVAYGEAVRARLGGDARAAAYVVRHHGAHLERSGAGFRELSRLVTPDWQRAWEALEGSFDGFLGDVERVAAHTEAALVDDAAEGAAAALYRLALVRASIGDVAGNVPGALLAGLVEAGQFPPAVALAYAGGNSLVLAAIAHLLPMPLVREALASIDGPARASLLSLRPAALEGLLRRLIDAGDAHGVVPALARQTPETRVRTLLALAPRLPAEVRPLAWAEIRATIAALDEFDDRGAFLLELAAQVPDDHREALIAEAGALLEAEGYVAEHVVLFGLAGAEERALQLARDQHAPELRAQYLAYAVAGTSGDAQVTAFREWAIAERALWSRGETSLRWQWPLPWPLPLPPLPLPRWLREAFVEFVRELPFPRERAFSFARLALVHGAAISEAIAVVQALDGPDRVFGLLAIAGVLDGPARTAALAEVLAAIRARRWGVPSEAWHRADVDWQPAAGKTGWHYRAPRTASELLATVARHLPADQRVPVLHEALSRSRTIGDDAFRAQALAAMAARLDGTARSEVLAAALSAGRATPKLLDRARALASLAPEFPEAAREVISTIAEIELGSHIGEAIAFGVTAARSLPEPERHAAIQTLFEIRAAHRDDDAGANALIALAPHLPGDLLERATQGAYAEELAVCAAHATWSDERRLAAVAAVVRAIKPRAGRPDYVQTQRDRYIEPIAPWLSMPLLREALSWAPRVDDEKKARQRAWLFHLLLPRLAELDEAQEAFELARTIVDPLGRTGVLCALVPRLPPALRATVIAEIMSRARALSTHRSGNDGGDLDEHYFLELSSVLGAHGQALELAEIVGHVLEPWRALSVWVKLAAATSPPERGAVLAVAVERALGISGGYHFAEFEQLTKLLAYAADLDRRALARLFVRALRHASRQGRDDLFIDKSAVVLAWVVCSLDALGGRAAIYDAASACQEVAAWFP